MNKNRAFSYLVALLISNILVFGSAQVAALPVMPGGAEAKSREAGLPAQSSELPAELKNVGIKEKLGETLFPGTMITTHEGKTIPLGSLFDGKTPVVLSLVYFVCPGLCNLHLNGLIEGLKSLDWKPGSQYKLLVLSFDKNETPDLAQKKRQTYLNELGRPVDDAGVIFATATGAAIDKITSEVGFRYEWNEQSKEWAHASAAVMLTPEGKIARYLHGVHFEPTTLKLGINEAGQGKVGSLVDQVVWYCYRYDPHQSKYTVYARGLLQMAGGVVILIMGFFLVPFWFSNRNSGDSKT